MVFLGNRVTDQSGRIAVFEEMASNPATMAAGKMTYFYGCLRKCVIEGELAPGSQPKGLASQEGPDGSQPSGSASRKSPAVDLPFIVEQSDAAQVYCQAKLGGHTTWIRLPESRQPPHWNGKYKDPVCNLVLALYGHPNSGCYWEAHCGKKFMQGDFRRIGDAWGVDILIRTRRIINNMHSVR